MECRCEVYTYYVTYKQMSFGSRFEITIATEEHFDIICAECKQYQWEKERSHDWIVFIKLSNCSDKLAEWFDNVLKWWQ